MNERFVLEQFPLAVYLPSIKGGRPKQRRIYIMPTRNGLFFMLMLLAMLLGAVNYNNSMVYILTFLLFSLLLLTMLHTYRNLSGMTMYEGNVTPVFCGNKAQFQLIMDNQNSYQRYAIHVLQTVANKWRLLLTTSDSPMVSCHVNPSERSYLKLSLLASQRGLLKVGRVKIYTVFPLGLFKAWAYIDMQQACLVYPQPQGDTVLPLSKLTKGMGLRGNESGTDDFEGFKNYQAGDSIKDIAWKIYAQEKGLVIKKFKGFGADNLKLGWHDVAHITHVEARLSQLCLWIITAESQQLKYSLEIPGAYADSAQGEQHMRHCLSLLAQYDRPAAERVR